MPIFWATLYVFSHSCCVDCHTRPFTDVICPSSSLRFLLPGVQPCVTSFSRLLCFADAYSQLFCVANVNQMKMTSFSNSVLSSRVSHGRLLQAVLQYGLFKHFRLLRKNCPCISRFCCLFSSLLACLVSC